LAESSHKKQALTHYQDTSKQRTMSSFAPFVAAAIRDKVVQELMEENEAMRNQVAKLRHFKTVEITGPGGTCVYARAQFDEDGGYRGNPNLWSVHFPTGKQLLPCP
jgi:hypothetical protein